MAHRSDWQKVDPDLRSHPAFAYLIALLGLRPIEVHGLLAGLWAMAYRQAEDGDLTRFKPKALAIAVGYEGEPQEMIDALVEAQFLDREDGRLTIHGWFEWGGAAFRVREDGLKRVTKHRERLKSHETPKESPDEPECNSYVTVTERYNGVTERYPLTLNVNSLSDSCSPEDLGSSSTTTTVDEELTGEVVDDDDLFEDLFWPSWPNKHGSKKTAKARFNAASVLDQQRILIAEGYLIATIADGRYDMEFLPRAENFVGGQKSFFEEWASGPPAKYCRGNGNGSKKQRDIDDSIARAVNSMDWPEEDS